nr:Protein H01G02.1, isoform a [Haemonchus contortus]
MISSLDRFEMSFAPVLLSIAVMSMLVGACRNLPATQYVGARAYILQQRMECRGGKVYDIDNVRDIAQCKEACRQFDCAAVNLFQLGEFAFKCEILGTLFGMVPATGSACYYASDLMGGLGGLGGVGGMGEEKETDKGEVAVFKMIKKT